MAAAASLRRKLERPALAGAPPSPRASCCCPFLACGLGLHFARGLCGSTRRFAPPPRSAHTPLLLAPPCLADMVEDFSVLVGELERCFGEERVLPSRSELREMNRYSLRWSDVDLLVWLALRQHVTQPCTTVTATFPPSLLRPAPHLTPHLCPSRPPTPTLCAGATWRRPSPHTAAPPRWRPSWAGSSAPRGAAPRATGTRWTMCGRSWMSSLRRRGCREG